MKLRMGISCAVLALTMGCKTSSSGTASDGSATVDLADPCTTGTTVTLDYFTTPRPGNAKPICQAQYTDELDNLSCSEAQGNCAGYKVVGFPNLFYSYDCFYDASSGALVGAFVTSDQGQACSAGTGHAQCPTVDYTVTGTCDGGTQ